MTLQISSSTSEKTLARLFSKKDNDKNDMPNLMTAVKEGYQNSWGSLFLVVVTLPLGGPFLRKFIQYFNVKNKEDDAIRVMGAVLRMPGDVGTIQVGDYDIVIGAERTEITDRNPGKGSPTMTIERPITDIREDFENFIVAAAKSRSASPEIMRLDALLEAKRDAKEQLRVAVENAKAEMTQQTKTEIATIIEVAKFEAEKNVQQEIGILGKLQEEARQLRENLEHEKEAVIKLQTQLKEAIAADNTKFEEQLDQKIATGIELGLEQKTQRTNEELSKLQPETEQLKLDVSKLRQQIVEIIRDHQNSLDFKLGEHEKQITTIAEKLENQMNLNQKLEELENEIIAITENLQNQTSQRLAELKKEITEITEEQHNETYKKLWELEKALTTVSEGVQNGNDGMEQLIAEGFETEKTKLKQEIKAFAQEMTSALKKETDRALDTITRNVVNLSQTRTNRGRSNSEPPSPLKETGAHPSLGANKMDEAKARAFSEEVNQVRLFPSYAIYETAITPKKKARLDKLKQDLTIKPFSPKELQKNFGKLMDGTIHDESEEEAEQPNISDNLLKMAGYGTPVAEKVRKVVDDELKIDC